MKALKRTEDKQMIFLCYPTCTTCKKAKKWPESNDLSYEERHIKAVHPDESLMG
jgi:arsenate reductase